MLIKSQDPKTEVWEQEVTIPTYEAGEPDKNPMFLEKRVYQGSSGRVYPHPVTETVSDEKINKKYKAIFLENQYLKVMILPEIGGRIQRIYDKTNGYDCVYYNEVVKPALVGLAGPWISGGIEFNWPQHHRPSTFDPVSCRYEANSDGSATVYVGETEKMFHTQATAAFTLYPDKAYLEIKAHLYNPTSTPKTFLWWANPAVEVNDFTQSIFPPDVNAVMDHGKRDVSKFPIADGVYYKVDYSPGTDISRYKNIPVPTSYMAYHSDFDFVGNYDHSKNAGLLHVADHHVSPGKKQWTWGCGDFGKAWDRNLCDDQRPYIELMTGVFTDNQPDFTFLAPYESKKFTQYFMPYKDAGAVKNAVADAMLNLEYENGKAHIIVYTPCKFNGSVVLSSGEDIVLNEKVSLSPSVTFDKTVECDKKDLYIALIDNNGRIVIDYTPYVPDENEKVPDPAQPALLPEEIKTMEELYLTGLHLEQYRHATYNPDDYYLEGLRRDDTDLRINNAYGKRLYERGLYGKAEEHFRKAVKKSTWKNPNPYDGEPFYNLGLALKAQGRLEEAFDMFYKSVWSDSMKSRGYYQMAVIQMRKSNFALAEEYIDESLANGMRNTKARNLKTILIRMKCDQYKAGEYSNETSKIDSLDMTARYERYLAGIDAFNRFEEIAHGDPFNYIETALFYADLGMEDTAVELMHRLDSSDDPMLHYHIAYLTRDDSDLIRAAECCPDRCFPNRLEDIDPLIFAAERNSDYKAMYYLGNILYDKGRHDDAIKCWEASKKYNSKFATVRRNLALAYYNKRHDSEAALAELKAASELDKDDMRVFFEYDQLLKQLRVPVSQRLENMIEREEKLSERDDLYTEYITLLNRNGQYNKALSLILNHKFHPWEGGEGKITKEYKTACVQIAKTCDHPMELLTRALTYPENLGEGKLAGEKDNDIYYYLGCFCPDKAKEYFQKAADCETNLTGAMYYNDQPPHMLYYAAQALKNQGMNDEAEKKFRLMIDYGMSHMNDDMKIDYFAVSLPDFLIFDADLNRKNRADCCYLIALGYDGLGDVLKRDEYITKMLENDPSRLAVM